MFGKNAVISAKTRLFRSSSSLSVFNQFINKTDELKNNTNLVTLMDKM